MNEKEMELANMPDPDGKYEEKIRKRFIKEHEELDHIIFFYTSHVHGKWMYYCTRCKTWHAVGKKLEKGKKARCEGCGCELFVTSYKKIDFKVRDYYTVIDRTKSGDPVLREFYAEGETPKEIDYDHAIGVIEVERINLRNGASVKHQSAKTMTSYGLVWHKDYWDDEWKSDKRTKYFNEYPFDKLVIHDRRQLRAWMKKTGLEYSGLKEAMDAFEWNVNIYRYITAWMKFPMIESFIKVGRKDLVQFFVDISRNKWEEENIRNGMTAKKTSMIIRRKVKCWTAEKIYTLKDIPSNPDVGLIDMMVKTDFEGNYEDAVDNRKLLRYLVKNNSKCRTYEDYIEMAKAEGFDISDKKVKYPECLKQEHDHLVAMQKAKKEIQSCKGLEDGIAKNCKDHEKLSMESDGLIIRPARSSYELYYEGTLMHHCVGTYVKKVAEMKTEIMFIRKKDDQNKPYVTLELKGSRIIQARAKYNAVPDDDVVKFINDWAIKNGFRSCFNMNR